MARWDEVGLPEQGECWYLHNMGIAPEAKLLFGARLCAWCSM